MGRGSVVAGSEKSDVFLPCSGHRRTGRKVKVAGTDIMVSNFKVAAAFLCREGPLEEQEKDEASTAARI